MAVVDMDIQKQAVLAHLDDLEMDHIDQREEDSDADFEIEEEPSSKKRREQSTSRKRTTRGMLEQKQKGGSFAALLQEAQLDQLPNNQPSYLTAVARPSAHSTARKLCSVCGYFSTYTCTRCGVRYCSRKCYAIHADTRCLKFMA